MISEIKGALSLDAAPPMKTAKVDPAPVKGSSDIHTSKATARIAYQMHGHGLEASAAGKSASIPTKEHKLGVEPHKGKHVDTIA